MIVVFPAKKKRSKVRFGSRWVYSKKITDMDGVRRARRYIVDRGHRDHQGALISDPRIWGAKSVVAFEAEIERRSLAFQQLPSVLRGSKWNGELAEHAVFCFPKGVILADQEKAAFERHLEKHFGRGSAAFMAWHQDVHGDKSIHLHVLISCFTCSAFPGLRVRETRNLTPGRDYLAQVGKIARDGVDLINRHRCFKELGAVEIPTLREIRELKRKEENEVRKAKGEPERLRFVEMLWLALGDYSDDEDDEMFRKRCLVATREKLGWTIKRETDGAMSVLPLGSERKQPYRMPFDYLRAEFSRLLLERTKSEGKRRGDRSEDRSPRNRSAPGFDR